MNVSTTPINTKPAAVAAPATHSPAQASDRTAALAGYGFLALRLAVGIVFAMHGWQKLSMMGIGGVAGFFGSLGIPAPEVAAIAVTALELLGGIALILGAGTRIAGALLAVNMLVALLLVHLPNGFFVDGGGIEFVLTLLGASLFFALAGPGPLAVDALLAKRK
jgi:putative oxidoreductase